MINNRILALGSYRPENIEVSFVEHSKRKTTPEIDAQIEVLWEELLQDSKVRGKDIWNGTTYRVEELTTPTPRSIKVEFAPIDFKTRECLQKIPGYYSLSEEYYRKGAYVGAFVRTVDGYFIFVKLSGLSQNNNKVDLLGGIVGDDMPVKSGEDLFEVLYKEMEEEAAIPKERVESCILKLIFLNHTTNVGFHFDVQLKDTKTEVEDLYLKNGKDKDISGLLFVSENDLPKQLDTMSENKVFLKEIYFKEQ